MMLKYAIALVILIVLAAAFTWAFLPARYLPGNRARHLRRDKEHTQPSPDQVTMTTETPISDACDHRQMQVRRLLVRPLPAGSPARGSRWYRRRPAGTRVSVGQCAARRICGSIPVRL